MRRRSAGFTIMEVMIALALLALALVTLIKSAAGSIFNAQQAKMMGISTDIARAKMYEIEEDLLKDGFSDTDLQEDWKPCFEDNHPEVLCAKQVVAVELPDWDNLQAMAQGHQAAGSAALAKHLGSAGSGSGAWAVGSDDAAALAAMYGSGAGSGSNMYDSFQNSALGGMLAQFGGGGGGGKSAGSGAAGGIDAAQGGAFIQGQYQMFQEILKVSVRKVQLKVKWQVLGSDREMMVVAYYTDGAAMDKVLSGAGSTDLPDASGSGSGSGSGSNGKKSNGTNGGKGG